MPRVDVRDLDRELGHRRDEDARDRDARERDADPRDPFVNGLELPRGPEREVVVDGDHRYELNGDDSGTLATVGAFRVVSERDLRDPREESVDWREPDLRHLRDEGLTEFVKVGGRERAVTLTDRGRHVLEAHRGDREDGREQTFYAGVSRERELSHDVQVYRAYLREHERLRNEGADIRRVALESELKREYQQWLQDRSACPERGSQVVDSKDTERCPSG